MDHFGQLKKHLGIKNTFLKYKFLLLFLIFDYYLGAAFILYNCARLSEIFKKFDTKVSKGEYPQLPEIDSVDFSLLNQHVSN